MNNIFQQINSWNHVGSLCKDDTPSMLRKVRFHNSCGQTGTAHYFYPCVLHRHALASKAFPEYLKTVLEHVTERVNFFRARARLLKVLYKD